MDGIELPPPGDCGVEDGGEEVGEYSGEVTADGEVGRDSPRTLPPPPAWVEALPPPGAPGMVVPLPCRETEAEDGVEP